MGVVPVREVVASDGGTNASNNPLLTFVGSVALAVALAAVAWVGFGWRKRAVMIVVLAVRLAAENDRKSAGPGRPAPAWMVSFTEMIGSRRFMYPFLFSLPTLVIFGWWLDL
jgi:hypothetical protein